MSVGILILGISNVGGNTYNYPLFSHRSECERLISMFVGLNLFEDRVVILCRKLTQNINHLSRISDDTSSRLLNVCRFAGIPMKQGFLEKKQPL